jgi:outer membrane immunogenic protein
MSNFLMARATLAAAFLVPIASGALAADMAPLLKAPPASAYYDWTGFYVGGNGGYSVGRDPTSATATSFGRAANVFQSEAVTMSPAGWLGGFQLGYNWQAGHMMLGVEGDWQWSGQRDRACLVGCLPASDAGGPLALNDEQKVDWFATVRGRVGYTADHWLWYVTGGAAFARIESNHVFTDGPGLLNPQIPTTLATSNASFNRGGVALGAGVETALAGNWTAKLEYLYVDFGSVTDTIATTIPGFGGGGLPATVTHTSDIRDHIIRAGLNYRFGGGEVGAAPSDGIFKAPRAAPPLPYSWTGAYVGANFGYGVAHDPATATLLGVANIFPPLLNQESFTLAPGGWLGGGQIGYNWQSDHLVLGLEADGQWSGQRDSACVDSCTVNGGSIIPAQKLNAFATARARVGYAANAWLWYVTGGGAWGSVSNSETFPPFGSISFNQSKFGWVAGAGVETALWGNWTAKLEYLYMDLGGASGSANFLVNPTFAIVESVTGTTTFHDHIFRAGVNYKFGGPVVAAY